ncbi:hypothetical protein ACFLZF_00180 [Nanoarchaeota archaeon]
MKRVIVFGLLVIVCLGVVSAQEPTKEEKILETKESVEEAVYSGDWKFIHTRIRFLQFWLNLFSSCGDKVCSEAEIGCPDDCGSFYVKNGFFNDETYKNKINFKDEKYDFEISGSCYPKDDSSNEAIISKGGKMFDATIKVKYSDEEEIFSNIEEGENFKLKNGESFFIDAEGCTPAGYVKVVSKNPICGDEMCWEGDCLQDCEGRFEVSEKNPTNINYGNTDYLINLKKEKGGVPREITANISIRYKLLNDSGIQEFFEASMFDKIILNNGLEIGIDSFYFMETSILHATLVVLDEIPEEEKIDFERRRESFKNNLIITDYGEE